MGIQHIQQRFHYFGEFVVDFVPDTRAEQCKRLDQPLDMRIDALLGLLQLQASGHLRVVARELAGHLPEKGKLVFVIPFDFVVHLPRATRNRLDSFGRSAS